MRRSLPWREEVSSMAWSLKKKGGSKSKKKSSGGKKKKK